MDLVQSVALAGGMAWASGLRLYAVILSAGLLGRFGYLQLPDALQVIQSPWILGLAAVLFVVDLVVPDVVPFADELLLGLGTLLLANWKRRKEPSAEARPPIEGDANRR